MGFSSVDGVTYPFPAHNTYFSGVIKPNNVTQTQMDQTVEARYNEWKQAYVAVRPKFPNQSYISYNQDHSSEPSNAVSVSEGTGYGMIIAAFMAGYDPQAQTLFDSLFHFYQAFPSVITPSLMGWQQILKNGNIIYNPAGGDDSATDGDIDIAFALLLADQQWGSEGSIDYLSRAKEMMTGILAGDVNEDLSVLKLGDWAQEDDEDDPNIDKATRPSDFALNQLRNFSASSGDPEWNFVINKTYGIINQLFKDYSPSTGLLPDFAEYVNGAYIPARTEFLENEEDGYYSWNACRTPWRIATDYILSGDNRAFNQLTKLNSWIRTKTGNDPWEIKSGYKLDGKPLVTYGDLAFSTPFAVSAMISSINQTWLNQLWAATSAEPTDESNYFNNSVRLLSLIVISGNWWTPLNPPPLP